MSVEEAWGKVSALIRVTLSEQLPGLPLDRLFLVTKKKKCWTAFGDDGFGSVDALWQQVCDILSPIPHCQQTGEPASDSIGPADSVSQVGVVVPGRIGPSDSISQAGVAVPEHYSLSESNDLEVVEEEKSDSSFQLLSNESNNQFISGGAEQ